MHDYWKNYWNNINTCNTNNLQLQIGRSINKQPISDKIWDKTISFIVKELQLSEKDIAADLCCGNGLITEKIHKKVDSLIAIDYSEFLIKNIISLKLPNVNTACCDLRNYDFKKSSLDKIILYFALQHFNNKETVHIFKKVYSGLKKGGIFYIGDIPNIDCIWNFYNNKQRENEYFSSILLNKPIIGNWFHPRFLEKLGYFTGFTKAKIINQPKFMINSHYRFDIKFIK